MLDKMTKSDPIKSLELLVESRGKATGGTWETQRAIIDIDYYDQVWTDANKYHPIFAYEHPNYSDADAHFVVSAANFASTEAPRLLAIIRRQREALELTERADKKHSDCKDCEGLSDPDICDKCFPFSDAARLARRSALNDEEKANV